MLLFWLLCARWLFVVVYLLVVLLVSTYLVVGVVASARAHVGDLPSIELIPSIEHTVATALGACRNVEPHLVRCLVPEGALNQ